MNTDTTTVSIELNTNIESVKQIVVVDENGDEQIAIKLHLEVAAIDYDKAEHIISVGEHLDGSPIEEHRMLIPMIVQIPTGEPGPDGSEMLGTTGAQLTLNLDNAANLALMLISFVGHMRTGGGTEFEKGEPVVS